ncbi:hypothetical protein GYMLUDRAFT_52896 [Collybiopsis luxurians FD-317 M1]|nr:hypothetical protein GYMLUDRAFT_52896 [Collybiopsis luxurians FD-317 M1]
MIDAVTFFNFGTSFPESEGQEHLAVFAVFDACCIQELLALRRTGKMLFIAVKYYFDKVFDIEIALERYLGSRDHAMEFHKKQHILGAALSGPFAAAFLGRLPELLPVVPLDILLNHEDVQWLADWLLGIGFHFVAESNLATLEPSTGFQRIFHTRQTKCNNNGIMSPSFKYTFTDREKMIILHGVTRGLMDAILSQESIYQSLQAALFNVVTSSEAYSIFPLSTFETREFRGKAAHQIHNYSASAGYWSLVSIDCQRHLMNLEFDDGVRYIGDQDCWHMILRPPLPPRERRVLLAQGTWNIEVVEIGPNVTLMRFRSQPIPPPRFKTLLQLTSWEICAVETNAGDKVLLSYDIGKLMHAYHCVASGWRTHEC